MIKIFYGNDRVKAREAINKLLGKDCEVIEAENLTLGDMDSVFLGTSLFGETRNILLKSLTENKECWEVLPKYLKTTHNVVIWENSVDKRSVVYKTLEKDENVEFKEFKQVEEIDKFLAFKVYDAAYSGNGKQAIKLCEQLETTSDPFRFMGLMTTQTFKKLETHHARAAKVLKILAETDMDMKSASVDGWTLVKAALLRIADF
jgi:DNA polymerase III delta subunit